MILILAVALSALGFLGWIVGSVFEYPAVAFIGAIFVVGVGAAVMSGGLEHRVGHTETNTTANQTDVTYTYQTYEPPNRFPLGELWLLFGAVMGLQSLNSLSEQ